MNEDAIRFGATVRASDGPAGTLAGVAIDAAAGRIEHLIVEPEHDRPHGHLVPVGKVGDDLTLDCTLDELRTAMPVVEVAMRPARDPQPFEGDADWTEVFHAAAQPAPGFVSDPEDPGRTAPSRDVGEDVAPTGEVELRRSAHVIASDYTPLGELAGFDVDADWKIAAVHVSPLPRHHDPHVTVAIADVAALEPDLVRLRLTPDAIRA